MKRETIPFELHRSPSMIGLSVRAIGTDDGVVSSPSPQRQHVATGPGTAGEKLWRLDSVFHCSIIGTCLSTGELRKLMQRITGNSLAGTSDHEVHHDAVAYCSSAEPARILHRALDERHAACIRRFAHLRSEAELIALWETVKQEGETRIAQEQVEALGRKLGLESARRERADRRADTAEAELAQLQTRFAAMRQELESVKQELEALDAQVAAAGNAEDAVDLAGAALAGLAVLYAGGRQGTVSSIARLVQKCGGTFVHHDGGVEERRGKLIADVHRADLVFFPVDCISHDAANAIKRACHAAGKPYYPLRSSGLTCFMAALSGAFDKATSLREAAI